MNQRGGTAGGASPARGGASEHHERRLERLIDRLPERLQKAIRWLRRPGLRWLRLVAGVLFIAGSFLSILPIFGIWMLPVGVVLLAEDIPAFRRLRDWLLDWIGRHRPHWLAAHHTPQVFNEGEEEVVKSFTDREYSRAHRGPLDWQTRVGPPAGTSVASAKICPDNGARTTWAYAQEPPSRVRVSHDQQRSSAMSRGFPSMTALLGLLAVAGYQHRDKIAEILGGLGQNRPGGTGQSSTGGFLNQLSESLGGASAGGLLGGGLGELVERFKQSGHGETAESWVGTGPNKPVTPPQLEQAIGPEVLETLSKQTGLSREELLARLSRELPDAVDKYTPQGRLPTEADFPRS